MAVLPIFWLWCAAAWQPGIWLFVVPACLPFLNFSPWTGWLVFDEFDILLLGALAGGYARLAYFSREGAETRGIPVVFWVLIALLAGTGLVSLYRGIVDAGGFSFDWFAGYTDALNSLRIFKSLGLVLLFVPLLQHELSHCKLLSDHRLAAGIIVGLAVVTLAAVWERAAFPGLLDFSKHYRTVALFWEMHVGGAAIDVYLVLTTPFVVWALICARQPLRWSGAAALALLTGYASLTTFSRGVYFAIAGSLLLLGLFLWAQKYDLKELNFFARVSQRQGFAGWHSKASLMLLLALITEVMAVMNGGSFMEERLVSTNHDLNSRLKHWRHGLDLLQSPEAWLLGEGLGRFPANYAAHVVQEEFSGDVKLSQEVKSFGVSNEFVTVRGPKSRKKLVRFFALTQRINSISKGEHQVVFKVRVKNSVDVYIKLCERHLLYDGMCQTAFVRVLPERTSWQTLSLPLEGHGSNPLTWHAPRLGMLSLSIGNIGGAADFDDIRLIGPHQQELLENGQFSMGLAHWFPAARFYFTPWHTDNLFLEILIERGLIGLSLLMVLMTCVFYHLVVGNARLQPLSPYLAASLSGALMLGLVNSLMDIPRVAFLYYVLTFYSLLTTKEFK